MAEELTKKKSDLSDQIDYKNLGFLKKFITDLPDKPNPYTRNDSSLSLED